MLFFRGFRGLGLAALLSVVGHAQIMNAVRVGQWTRGGYAWHEPEANAVGILDDQNKVVERIHLPPCGEEAMPLKEGVSFRLPSSRLGCPYFWKDAWYVVRSVRDAQDPKQVHVALLKKDENGWRSALTGTVLRDGSPDIYPFGDNRYLVITRAPLPVGTSGKWSPFQVFKADAEDRLGFDVALDPDLKGAVEQELRLESITFVPVLAGERLVLLSPHRGRLWCFHLGEGRLERTLDLFTLPATKTKTAFGFLPAYPLVLGVMPRADGTMLLVGRSERALDELARETDNLQFRGRMLLDGTSKEQKDSARERLQHQKDEVFGSNPILQWWSYDPGVGRVLRLDHAPQGGVDIVQTEHALEQIKLRPLSNGDLVPLPCTLALPKK